MARGSIGAGLGAVAVLIAAVVLMQQYYHAKRLRTENAVLREQVAQAAHMHEQVEALNKELAAASQRRDNERGELLRLRAQGPKLQQKEEELTRLKRTNSLLRSELDRAALGTNPQWRETAAGDPFDGQHGPGARVKVNGAKHWGYALINYAANHQDQFPPSLTDAVAFMNDGLSGTEKTQAVQTADQYEMLYHGTTEALETLPPESTIIVREKMPWLNAEGKWCKAYCLADGSAYIRSSEVDDFAQWENLRIPKTPGR